LTSFGGPVAHLGYFRQEFVERRKWLTERAFADLVALCNFLPAALLKLCQVHCFLFAAYLGAAKSDSPIGWLAGIWCVFAISLPPMLLVRGLLPLSGIDCGFPPRLSRC
jgi:chromate transport protein ChrA